MGLEQMDGRDLHALFPGFLHDRVGDGCSDGSQPMPPVRGCGWSRIGIQEITSVTTGLPLSGAGLVQNDRLDIVGVLQTFS